MGENSRLKTINAKLALMSLGALLVCLLVVVQFVFYVIQAQLAKNAEVALKGLVEDGYSVSNPYYLSQMVAGLERSQLLRCVSIKKPNQSLPFYRSGGSGCNNASSPIFLRGASTSSNLRAANGEIWSVDFIGNNGRLFYLSLWLTRVSTILALLLVYIWNVSRIRHVQKIEALKSKSAREFEKFATQVAHDIRSPLAALEVLLSDASGFPREDRQTLTGAASRIREIANELLDHRLQQEKSRERVSAHCCVIHVVNSIVLEKRAQFRNREEISFNLELPSEVSFCYTTVPAEDLKRIVSNLLNNAVEAMAFGQVKIQVIPAEAQVEIRIRDEGTGIPEEVLSKLGTRGFSTGKSGESGSGLGLSHAFELSKNWGGSLKIESAVGQGTEVTLSVPAKKSSSGMFDRYSLIRSHSRRAVLIDNDLQVHALWQRVASKREVELLCFAKPDDFFSNVDSFSRETEIFLDWDLGPGIDPILVGSRLSELGFAKISVCTGSPNLVSKELSWITQVLGKDPPWL